MGRAGPRGLGRQGSVAQSPRMSHTQPPDLPAWTTLHAHDAIGSTSDEARRLAEAGAADGTAVWARRQVAGRGRLGRPWSSPVGNLYVSVVLRRGPPARAAELGFACALAVADLAAGAAPHAAVTLKWPNDVLLGGAKLAGVLLEATDAFVVAGLGVNLAAAPEGLPYPATTLAAHGAPLTPEAALGRLLHALHARLAERDAGFAHTRAAWLARGPTRGAAISVTVGGVRVEGRFAGLGEDGALLAVVGGAERRFVAGEVGFG